MDPTPQINHGVLARMTNDTRTYCISQSLDEWLSNLIEVQQMHQKRIARHLFDPDPDWLNKRIEIVKLLHKSSVLVDQTDYEYHYEIHSRELTYLTLIEPEFVAELIEHC